MIRPLLTDSKSLMSSSLKNIILVSCACLYLVGCSGPPHLKGSGQGQFPSVSSRHYCVRGHGCYHVFKNAKNYQANGVASWYNQGSSSAHTSSGAPFDPDVARIANKRLPIGTWVRITDKQNGRHAVAMVDDRGPYQNNRIIDVTPTIARRLGFYQQGKARVHVQSIPESQLTQLQRQDQQTARRLARN